MEIGNQKFVCSSCGSTQQKEPGMCCGNDREKECNCGSGKGEKSCDCNQ